MSQILLTGATGLVGGHLLRLLQSEPNISTIAVSTCRPLVSAEGVFNPHDSRLTDALVRVVDPADIVLYCLGTTRREAGSKEAFVHTDYTLVIDTALVGKRLGAQHMLAVSAMGANVRSLLFYNWVKREMEAVLIEQAWPWLIIAQPSVLSSEWEKKRVNEAFLEPLFRLLPGNWRAIPACGVVITLLAKTLSSSQKGV